MGCLLLLNDDDRKSFWRSNIFKLEHMILIENIIVLFLLLISAITFPYKSIKFIRKENNPKPLIAICLISSIFLLIISILIKYIHTKKEIKPNYRLCIMHCFAYFNLTLIILCLIFSFCVSTLIIKWANIYEFVQYKNTPKIIYIYILYNIITLFSFFEFIDILVETIVISKASKFLSEGNNINNQKILLELFKINYFRENLEKLKDKNTFDLNEKYNENKSFKKFRIIFPNNKEIKEENNSFENDFNKFREVELIEKVEYKSIGIQTEENNKEDFYNKRNNYDNNDIMEGKNLEEDISKNVILVKNKSLISSFNSSD